MLAMMEPGMAGFSASVGADTVTGLPGPARPGNEILVTIFTGMSREGRL